MNELIVKFAKKKYKYFSIDLWLIVTKILPSDLEDDRSCKYALATKEKNRIYWLKRYSKYYKNTKNHKMASKQIANNIIEHFNENKECDKDLIELVVENMPKVLPDHNDSVDCFTIMMYLQKDILDLGYIVVNTSPLRLDTNN